MTAFTEEERVVDDALGYPNAYARLCRAGGARSACPTPTARLMPSSPTSSSPTSCRDHGWDYRSCFCVSRASGRDHKFLLKAAEEGVDCDHGGLFGSDAMDAAALSHRPPP